MPSWRTVLRLRRNALVEATIGLAVLAIVGALGTLPPGLHTEPGWPFPFRLDLAALTGGAKIVLAILGVIMCVSAVAAVALAAAGRYRRMAAPMAVLVAALGCAWIAAEPGVEPAYPTSFYAPAEPYAAASVVQGAALYAENCALCHGATGQRGDGPAAAQLPIRPADLSEPHLFAHTPGDLFWWVSNGRGNGAMPGFAGVMTPSQRWDVINFILARAAAVLARRVGPTVTPAAAPAIPDFAFETAGGQQTLSGILETRPALLVLFTRSPSGGAPGATHGGAKTSRIRAADFRSDPIWPCAPTALETEMPSPLIGIAADVATSLALFRTSDDEGDETDLLLDQAGRLRVRWVGSILGGLPPMPRRSSPKPAGSRQFSVAPVKPRGSRPLTGVTRLRHGRPASTPHAEDRTSL